MMNVQVSFDCSVTDIVEKIKSTYPETEISFMHFRPLSEWQAISRNSDCVIASQKHETPEEAIEELYRMIASQIREAA